MNNIRPLEILSLGGGIQSSTIFLMSCRGELPKLDAAVFADTGWELPETYTTICFLAAEGSKSGVPVYIESQGNIKTDTLAGVNSTGQLFATMPFFLTNQNGTPGQLRRQCTNEYKIKPVNRCIKRRILGLKPRQRAPYHAINLWYGISTDEIRRIRDNPNGWRRNRYPLIFDKPMNREKCIDWLAENYPNQTFTRSACIGCPYHTNYEWRKLKARPEWPDIIDFDDRIRNITRIRADAYLHQSRKPIDTVDLRDQAEIAGQLSFECLGNCFT